MGDKRPVVRGDFSLFYPVVTRWMDNDIYGHVNNVTYYSWFDSVANRYLIEAGGMDIHGGNTVAYVVHSSCDYFSPVAYPQYVDIGLRVEHLGRSSVRYGFGVFVRDAAMAAAAGEFIHVFVDRRTDQSVEIPAPLVQALKNIKL
jgi:acyl-CoA thioester hydrolase